MISRRAALKGLVVGGGAALWTACAPRQAEQASPVYPTATAYPTGTPYPTVTPTPDLTPVIDQARGWFAIDEVVGTIPLKPGGRYGQALVARVAGRQRAIAVTIDGKWEINIPRLSPDLNPPHPGVDISPIARALTDQGYGIDLDLGGLGSPKTSIFGVPGASGVLRSNCYGDLFELPPTGTALQVHWTGSAWVGGFLNGNEWQPPLPSRFDGTEKSFTGDFLLTCDDCHDEEDTRSILAVAEGIGAKMTFFPNTPYVKQFSGLFKDIAAAGHEIGYHTTTHANGDWSPASLESDCSYFETVVREITGMADYRVVTARPPFGLWYQGGWQDWVESQGIVTAMWSRTIGWDSTPKVIRRTITENGGLILLAHANPLNVKWFEDNADLIEEFATKYRWLTITESLLKDWQPVKVVGLPVGMLEA